MVKPTITELIRVHLRENGRTLSWLADKLGDGVSNFSQKMKKSDLDSSTVERISIVLKHDFFADLSSQLPVDVRHKHNVANISIDDIIEQKIRKILNK